MPHIESHVSQAEIALDPLHRRLRRIAEVLNLPVDSFLDADGRTTQADDKTCLTAQMGQLQDAFLSLESASQRERCVAFVRDLAESVSQKGDDHS